MMSFTYSSRRTRRERGPTLGGDGDGGNGCLSQPLATLAGYKILAKGGNAVDAAVAMVSTLSVVEPYSVGIGGDAFALIYLANEDRLVGLNGSGRAPYGASVEWFQEKGLTQIPERNILAVTVPGALHGWGQALERFGTMGLGDVFEDAIRCGEHGYPVTELIAGEWKNSEGVLLASENAAKTYLIDGRPLGPDSFFLTEICQGPIKRLSATGQTLFTAANSAAPLSVFPERHGGLLSRRDFEDHRTTWVDPISTDYRGLTILELPPNGQGMVALEMLNILEGCDVAGLGHNVPSTSTSSSRPKKRPSATGTVTSVILSS